MFLTPFFSPCDEILYSNLYQIIVNKEVTRAVEKFHWKKPEVAHSVKVGKSFSASRVVFVKSESVSTDFTYKCQKQ